LFVICITFGKADTVHAQDRVSLGGTAFVDYYYNFSSLDEEAEGMNGFTYRRVFLTADFRISESFDSRIRLEATQNSVQPFIKDLYVRWTSSGGHRVFFGITNTPAFDITEEVWLFRSLERTILDLNGVVSSRDFGVRADGPLLPGGLLRYAVMFGNNNASSPEDDRYKRGYGRLDLRPGSFIFSIGGDYAGYGDERSAATRFSGLAGYAGDRLQLGIEAFLSQTYLEDLDDTSLYGASLWGSWWFTPRWGVVGRFDRVVEDLPDEAGENVIIGGVVFQPNESLRFIPNVYARKADAIDETDLTGRFTVELQL
jgi:hypothetical protein